MNSNQFRRAVLKLFGREPGYVTRAAEGLSIDKSTVSRYINGELEVSGTVARLTKLLLRGVED